MQDLPDYELNKVPDDHPAPAPKKRPVGWALLATVLLVAAGVAAYLVFKSRRVPETMTTAAPVATSPETLRPLGGEAQAIDLPPLDQTDPLVRALMVALSSHPRVAAWLATDGLVRNFTVAVTNLGDGTTPAVHLRALRPSSTFTVVQHGEGQVIDPRSYGRYDDLADAAEGIDPSGAARVYATLKPRIEEAYRDLGHPDEAFDRTLERAIVRLLETPIVEGDIRVEPAGAVGYRFIDPELEALTAAQKQLLRTGPDNVRAIQSSLRAIAGALGIPAARLPAPRTVRAR